MNEPIERRVEECRPSGRRQPRWGWVAWRVAPLAVVVLVVGGWNAAIPWGSQLPTALARSLTEWFLHGLLTGYAVLLAAALVGTFGLPVYVLAGRRRGIRRPWAARFWLLSASSLLGLIAVEVSAACWLVYAHRMPVLPTTFSEPTPPGETTISVIGESSARGFPYHPELSVGQIVAWQLERAMPGARSCPTSAPCPAARSKKCTWAFSISLAGPTR